MSYSFSYSPPVPGTATKNATDNDGAPLYALGDLEFLPLNAGATLLINRDSGAQEIVSSDVAQALAQCSLFATLDTHVSNIVAALPALAEQQAVVRSTLQQLADKKILASAENIVSNMNGPAPDTGRARSRVFIITCDRPTALGKLLDSLASMPGLSRHESFFLVDSSRDPANVEKNRELVEIYNTRSARGIAHISPQRQKELCLALCEKLPQHAPGISFLLDRQRHADFANYGVARNFCLLLSAGKRAVVMDDDILAYRLRAPEETSGFRFAGGVASEVRFFPDIQTVLGNIEALEESAIDEASLCLGLPLAAVPAALKTTAFNAAELRGAPGIIVEALDADSRVLVTQCGTLGDPGTDGAGWLHFLNGPSRRSLLDALGKTGSARVERWCWRGTSSTTVAKMASMSQLTGLDNTALLPPYFPYFRGEDLLFGAAVDFVHPRAAVLEHNWCVAHVPETSRRAIDLESDPVAGSGNLGLVARRISDAVDPRSGSTPQLRLGQLAELLDAEAARSDWDLTMAYRSARVKASIDQLASVSQQLQDLPAGGAGAWKSFLERSANDIGKALQYPWRPGDLLRQPDDDGDRQALEYLRGMLGDYAAGLRAWPAVREHADEVVRAAEVGAQG